MPGRSPAPVNREGMFYNELPALQTRCRHLPVQLHQAAPPQPPSQRPDVGADHLCLQARRDPGGRGGHALQQQPVADEGVARRVVQQADGAAKVQHRLAGAWPGARQHKRAIAAIEGQPGLEGGYISGLQIYVICKCCGRVRKGGQGVVSRPVAVGWGGSGRAFSGGAARSLP